MVYGIENKMIGYAVAGLAALVVSGAIGRYTAKPKVKHITLPTIPTDETLMRKARWLKKKEVVAFKYGVNETNHPFTAVTIATRGVLGGAMKVSDPIFFDGFIHTKTEEGKVIAAGMRVRS